jgi:hypothetical protein
MHVPPVAIPGSHRLVDVNLYSAVPRSDQYTRKFAIELVTEEKP